MTTSPERQRLDEARRRLGASGRLLIAPFLIAFALATLVLERSIPFRDGSLIVGLAALLIAGLVADRRWSQPVPAGTARAAVAISSALGVGLGITAVVW